MKEIIVEKSGSELASNQNYIAERVRDIASIQDEYSMVVVSSGAAAIGRQVWRNMYGDRKLPSLQVLATMGSARLNVCWEDAFAKVGLVATQILATPHEIHDPIEQPELERVTRESLDAGMIPVFNGNDAMTRELVDDLKRFADNDGYAQHIACLLGAKALILRTKKGGLYNESDIEVPCIMPEEYSWAENLVIERAAAAEPVNEAEAISRGGMPTKLPAAIRAARANVDAYIVGPEPSIGEVLAGKAGTYLPAVAKVV